ncbi:MAG: CDP-diacylglycerol--serine O-phosphatidyltransferase [Methylococcales bacterium]|nr:CDP-diacylglycerol--serine O-phosphatidyltransferase [Methylococcales bacterium]
MEHTEENLIRRKGIYLLPNLFTTAALFCGFYAIITAIHGKFEAAAIAIFVAMIMDGLDGRVARMTNTQSDFGCQYDSLSDMVSFGLAPALMVYLWSLSSLGKIGWFAAFVYTAGTALRLARFNTQAEVADKKYFQGLASPAAAAIIAGMIWVAADYNLNPKDFEIVSLIITITAGLFMVSNIRYHSFKEIDFKNKVPFLTIVGIMLAFAIIFLQPPLVLFGLFTLYGFSGPIYTLLLLKQKRTEKKNVANTQS